MSRTGLEILHDGLPDLLRRLAAVAAQDVLVGVPGDGAPRNESGAPSNAEIGYQNDFGSPAQNLLIHHDGGFGPAQNIPARPHLYPGIEKCQARTTKQLARAARAAAEGRLSQVATALHAAGLIAQASVRNEITSGAFTPLSARTLAERQARGRTGTKPLVDTGQYRNSITYVVRDGKS